MVCTGDRPHCTSVGLAEAEERQPMDQISSIEHFLEAGDAAVSNEVAQQARHVNRTKLFFATCQPYADANLLRQSTAQPWTVPSPLS